MKTKFLHTLYNFESFFIPFAQKISHQKHLSALKNSMTLLMPLTIIGGLSCLLAQPPIHPDITNTHIFFQLLLKWYNWAQNHYQLLMMPYHFTLGIISIYVVIAMTYLLSKQYKLPCIETIFSTLVIYLCISCTIEEKNISISNLGVSGMFFAIILSITCVEIVRLCFKYNIKIRMPTTLPASIAAPFAIIIPLFISLILFISLNQLCIYYIHSDLCNLINTLTQSVLSASETLPSMLFIYLIAAIFWFFGIHGDNIIGTIINPLITLNVALNLEAYQNGQEMTHVFAGQFLGIWGGWMTSWAILISIIIISHSTHLRSLCKLVPMTTLFNINEPLIFGIPLVLNFYIFIPVFICKIINITVAYYFSVFGLIGKIYVILPWTTPAFIAAFLSTMDIKAFILWIALLIMDVFIMIPFIYLYDKNLLKKEQKSYNT